MKRLKLNTIGSIAFQITTIICGFIVPQAMIHYYGSEVNGLISSIAQFLSLITFLELGVGAVIQSSLYKPLAENKKESISAVISSGENYFRRVGTILLIYVIVLMVVYPLFVESSFEYAYISSLIIIISISSFAQYFFSIIDRILLMADQKGYIYSFSQTACVFLSTLVCVILAVSGVSIHIVRIATSMIYILCPVFIRKYVNLHYDIDRHYRYTKEPIEQKWNGIAQHIAYVILVDTDTIVLTLLSSLANVSIYAVYNLVITGIRGLIMSSVSGVQALLGELWAKKNNQKLMEVFTWLEWIIHNTTVFLFGCVSILIVPFVSVYTRGITDANYIQPIFAIFITAAQAWHCLRIPYHVMILASGQYKQTQHCYIIAATLNLLISIITVKMWGLIGVAVGTLVAMAYQTIWMARYNSKMLIKIPFRYFVKQVCIDIIIVAVGVSVCSILKLHELTYISWIKMAIVTSFIWIFIIIAINSILCHQQMKFIFHKMTSRIKREKELCERKEGEN